jgi:hypothetical protein
LVSIRPAALTESLIVAAQSKRGGTTRPTEYFCIKVQVASDNNQNITSHQAKALTISGKGFLITEYPGPPINADICTLGIAGAG